MALPQTLYRGRRVTVIALFAAMTCLLLGRAVELQLTDRQFLQSHGDARILREMRTPAHRGVIMDRLGEPLAISSPVISVWANPRLLQLSDQQWRRLAELLDTDKFDLQQSVAARKGKDFVYLRRRIAPDIASQIMREEFQGVAVDKEFRRYYPEGEVTAHLLGFTNIDDNGQEGLELAYDHVLRGRPGAKRVIKDNLGRVVENVESIRASQPGRDLRLSIDKRLQYVAYRELKAAVLANRAQSGTVVVLDAQTGEVLAMVNQPSYNPNNREGLRGEYYRNRAMTDVFEPGSTIKPFTIAAALESGEFKPTTPVETGPGFFSVGEYKVRDVHNYGTLSVSNIITKSSNVGAAKVSLALGPRVVWTMFNNVGFGRISTTGFPGESGGRLTDYHHWREIEQATLAFGYGLSVNALQLAHAYTAFANDGVMVTPSLLKVDKPGKGVRVMSAQTARDVRAMLESVVRIGTGRLANVPGYRVAGKTGTVHKTGAQGYVEDHYLSLFAGMVPASNPRLVAVVVVDDPRNGEYYGGRVAAPIFGSLMREALRLLNVAPDEPLNQGEQVFAYVPPLSPESYNDMGQRPEP